MGGQTFLDSCRTVGARVADQVMRIAFVTPEYPSEVVDAGGLGTYVHRTAKLLVSAGHTPEVFVPTKRETRTRLLDDILVHQVNWAEELPWLHIIHRASSRLLRSYTWRAAFDWLAQAWALAASLERRHAESPFRLVQSADYLAAGMFVRRRRDRTHAVRCSSSATLYSHYDGVRSATHRVRGYLERLCMRRADVSFAPSRYLAEHFRGSYGLTVKVIRPPMFLEHQPASELRQAIPQRFFLHFGQLMERKGSALLATALPLAWEVVPELTMVWSGVCWDQQKLLEWQNLWGHRRKQVLITGPLAKPELYAVLERAEATVLPSQVDNLPNTVIESLMFGVPVIGSRGASIDELVEEGRTGQLVPLGDASALADALIRQWQGLSPVRKGFRWDSDTACEMRPERALASLLALA